MLDDKTIWDLIYSWVGHNKKIINLITSKYSWLTSSEKEDVLQDVYLICYKVIRMIEKENQDYNFKNLNEDKKIRNKIIGHYRVFSWNNRSELSIRADDVYNLSKDDDKNSNMFVKNDISNIENIIYKDILKDDDDFKKNETIEKEEKLEKIKVLSKLLSEKRREIFNSMFTGDDTSGYMSSKEAGIKYNLKHNSVNKGVQHGIIFIKKFLKENNITKDTPLEEVKKIVENYIVNIGKSTTEYHFGNIENFLKSNDNETVTKN